MKRGRTIRVVRLRVLVAISFVFALGVASAGCGVNLCGVYNCDTFPAMADLDGRINASLDAAIAAFFGASAHDEEANGAAHSEEEEGESTEGHEEEGHEEGEHGGG